MIARIFLVAAFAFFFAIASGQDSTGKLPPNGTPAVQSTATPTQASPAANVSPGSNSGGGKTDPNKKGPPKSGTTTPAVIAPKNTGSSGRDGGGGRVPPGKTITADHGKDAATAAKGLTSKDATKAKNTANERDRTKANNAGKLNGAAKENTDKKEKAEIKDSKGKEAGAAPAGKPATDSGAKHADIAGVRNEPSKSGPPASHPAAPRTLPAGVKKNPADSLTRVANTLHAEVDRLKGRENWLIGIIALLTAVVAFFGYRSVQQAAAVKKMQKDLHNAHGNSKNVTEHLQRSGILTATDIRNDGLPRAIDAYAARYRQIEQLNAGLNEELGHLKQQLAAAAQPAVAVVAANAPGAYIKTEIILSAGPRKDAGSKDTEMGEDIAGSISTPRNTFFWLLDGTSDNAIIKGLDVGENEARFEETHIFSSRVLAQSIGHYLQLHIMDYAARNFAFDELLSDAAKQVAADWEKRINNEPDEKQQSILQAIKSGYKPICSTTVILGCLSDSGHLVALRTGDSKIFPFRRLAEGVRLDKEFKFASDPTGEYDRVAFRLDLDPTNNRFVIRQNNAKCLVQSATAIDSVFAFSDGIGRVTEAQLSSGNPGIVDMIRQSIGRIPQKTHDDKTLIILERINPAS